MNEGSSVDRLADAVLRSAQRAMEKGDWTEASELARQVLEVVPENPTAASMLVTAEAGGRLGASDQGRRYLTVLFSDVVGSTSLSERLDPEDYLAVIAAYREAVREVVAHHGGHVDQFQGDGVVAYFGFPIAGEDDSVRAVEAGLDIVRAVPKAGAKIGVDLGARVGVHVGRTVMTSSNLGVRDRDTAVGFATNVAARIQGLASTGTVVVSETVVDFIAPYFELAPIGPHQLRGVSDDVSVFTVREPRTRSTMGDDRLRAPLVGRREERERIDLAWQAARDGGEASRLLVIAGEPGIGKSRLARFAIERAHDDQANVIEINCGRDFRHVGLGAIRRGIEKALDLGRGPTPVGIQSALQARAEVIGLSGETRRVIEALMGAAPARTSNPDSPS